MRTLLCGFGAMSLLLLAVNIEAQVDRKAVNSYLDQAPPGRTPVIFAPGVVSKHDIHSRLAISPDGKEMCWTSLSALPTEGVAKLLCVANVNGKWTNPQTPSFASKGDTTNPLFSPDGKRLFFNHKEGGSDWVTQYVERTESGWSGPKSDGFLLKTSSSFTRSGKVYFSDSMTGKPWNSGIYRAEYSAGGYVNRQALGATINSPYIDYTPYISPDEAYLMFSSSRPSVDENMFLYSSFKNKDGTWSAPRKMNEAMNFSGNARFPSISPDEKYLFFCGDDGNIYWVDIGGFHKRDVK
jgi:Tol biopolymer transport system component